MRRLLFTALLIPVVGLIGYLTYLSIRIGRQSTLDETRPADAILVLGAAEYRGHPSPVFKARLDHALDLYERKLAQVLITTGGAGGDPDYTEGGVGRTYLIEHNVPSEAIVVEPESETTAHSTVAAGEILERMGLKSCLLVSDGYHIFRAKKMLESRGIQVYGSPRPSSGHDDAEQWWLYFRQSVGYLVWRVGLSG
jgi:uncharacterized SAM-binding protein YcdF (DUF218 family)